MGPRLFKPDSRDPIFTNIPDGLWVAGLAQTRSLPAVTSPLSDDPNELLNLEMSRIKMEVDEGGLNLLLQGS